MANKYQVLDQILTSDQGASGNYNIVFTTLDINDEDEGTEVVKAISEKIKEDINYSDLKNSPGIPQEGYEEINGKLQPTKDFHKVAFTGNYAHLNDAPTIPLINGQKPTEFDPIAFTGSISLDNVQVSNVINFYAADASSNSPRITATLEPAGIVDEYNYRLANLGSEDTYILGFAYNGDPLANTISQFAMKFRNRQLPSFFVTKAGTFLVLDIEFNPTTLEYTNYIKFTLAQVNEAYYNGGSTINQNNIDPQDDQLIDAKNILNDITFTKKNVSFIFDYTHQAIFCKTSTTDDASQMDTSNFIIHANQIPELKQVATTGSYNDLTNKPILDASANNSNITGLATIATSGNYDDLNNKPIIGNKIYKLLDSSDNNIKFLLQDTIVSNLNSITVTIDTNDNILTIVNWLNLLINYYNQYPEKIIKIITIDGQQYIVINIAINGNGLFVIDLMPYHWVVYNYDVTLSDQQMLNSIQINETHKIIIYDANNQKIFVK